MGRLYMETSALRKLTTYSKSDNLYTSIFALFELVSGICNQKEFDIRRAAICRVIQSGIYIDWDFVDKKLCSFWGDNSYDNTFSNIFKIIIHYLMQDDYCCFKSREIEIRQQSGFIIRKKIIEWLQNRDKKIAEIRYMCEKMFDENKDFIVNKYRHENMKGLADYLWNKYKNARFDETRLSHAEGFCGKNETDKVRLAIDKVFRDYTFKLFLTAQAIIFVKAIYIDGGTQDRNNPSDLLHLLYLNEGDRIISYDKIFYNVSEGIDSFHPIVLTNEKSIYDINEKSACNHIS